MDLVSLIKSVLFLGFPVLLIGWFLLGRLYKSGRLDRDATGKRLKVALEKIKEETSADKSDRLQSQLMKFGGGFYGVTALWTLIVQELTDLVRFASNLAEELARIFADGIIDLVVNLLVNQFTNFVTAILWFAFWPDQTGSSTIVVLAIAYAGYLVGLRLARADATVSFQPLRQLWRGANDSANNIPENGPINGPINDPDQYENNQQDKR